LANLSDLQDLGLGGNQLSGAIPSSLGNLSKLLQLDLSQDQLSGEIPSSLGNLSNLQYLELYENQLSGEIPSSLGDLSNLQYLELYDNQLSGAIPSSLGNLSNLQYLELYENQLSGEIPSSLGNLSKLLELRLSDNQLNGAIPSSLGNLSNLQYLRLDSNQLSGAIPSSLGNLSNLQDLDLDGNQLSGAIPSSLGDLSNLLELDLGGNQLSGAIPSSLGNLSKLLDFGLGGNQLSGAIPSSLGNLSKLQELVLRDNQLDISEVSGSLQVIQALRARGTYVDYLPQLSPPTLVLHGLADAQTVSNIIGDIDSPLVPVTDPNALISQPVIQAGLVADGVTPLILEFQFDGTSTTSTDFTVTLDQFQTKLFVLTDGEWQQGNTITVPSGGSTFAYLAAIDPTDLGSSPEQVVNLTFGLNSQSLDGGSFKVRKPPIFLVHGYYSDANTWSQGFLDELKNVVQSDSTAGVPSGDSSDFIRKINYGVISSSVGGPPFAPQQASYPNTYGALLPLAAVLDSALSADEVLLKKDWAFTRYDVIAHSQGGVLARMLCAQNSPTGGQSFASVNNFNRGRFRRIVTIGSPQNGSRLVHYLLQEVL
jgi:Leucine-rich repeat (LRR) protein/pimeloyl-ACP methyl ester carboxylesterase